MIGTHRLRPLLGYSIQRAPHIITGGDLSKAQFSTNHDADVRRLRELLGERSTIWTSHISPRSLHVMIEQQGTRIGNDWPSTGKLVCGSLRWEEVSVVQVASFVSAGVTVLPAVPAPPNDTSILDEPVNLHIHDGLRFRDVSVNGMGVLYARVSHALQVRKAMMGTANVEQSPVSTIETARPAAHNRMAPCDG